MQTDGDCPLSGFNVRSNEKDSFDKNVKVYEKNTIWQKLTSFINFHKRKIKDDVGGGIVDAKVLSVLLLFGSAIGIIIAGVFKHWLVFPLFTIMSIILLLALFAFAQTK